MEWWTGPDWLNKSFGCNVVPHFSGIIHLDITPLKGKKPTDPHTLQLPE